MLELDCKWRGQGLNQALILNVGISSSNLTIIPNACPVLCASYSKLLSLFRVFLWFLINYRIVSAGFVENVIGVLKAIVLYLQITVSSMGILMIYNMDVFPILVSPSIFFHKWFVLFISFVLYISSRAFFPDWLNLLLDTLCYFIVTENAIAFSFFR